MKNLPTRSTSAPISAAGPAPARRAGRLRGPKSEPSEPSEPSAADARRVDDIRDAVTRLKRERIIAVAVDLFYSQGFSNTRLETVAERMNVTKPFIYAHFRSKSELLAEICSRGIRASLDAIKRIVSAGGTPTAQVQTLARDFMQAVLDNQQHIAIYSREEKHLEADANQAINDMRREFDRELTGMLRQGMESGEFRIADAKMASLAIGGIASWSYVWFREEGRLTREEVAQQMVGLVMNMLQVKASALKAAGRAVP